MCITVSIERQIECVKREIRMRERVYPRRVAEQRMTQQQADAELAAMRAVLETIEREEASVDLFSARG